MCTPRRRTIITTRLPCTITSQRRTMRVTHITGQRRILTIGGIMCLSFLGRVWLLTEASHTHPQHKHHKGHSSPWVPGPQTFVLKVLRKVAS